MNLFFHILIMAVLSFYSLMVLQLLGSWMYREITLRMDANGSSLSAWALRQRARLLQWVDRGTPDLECDMADGVS